ncbi:MAG: type II CRISPR-associated endonuclease Cas1 [Prolixibacteraceae bacterium]
MIKRTLYFGNPAYLHKKDLQLKVSDPETKTDKASIPLEDIAVVLLDHPQITVTHALMASLIDRNVAFISCDQSHLPTGLMLPLNGNHVQTERFRIQIAASEPLLKNLWAQTIKAKIGNQAAMLKRAGIDNKKLLALLPRIKSGDPDNVEGRAAAVYWKLVYGEHGFTRNRNGMEPNAHLNYCYAILRAIVARALVSSGMLPTLGIHHRNKYNAYCLADDIMEPYRPFCDELVYQLFDSGAIDTEELTREHKASLLGIVTTDVLIDGKKSPLMVAISRTTSSLFECFEGTRRKIVYPDFFSSLN